jgi:chromate transport protein ChrA
VSKVQIRRYLLPIHLVFVFVWILISIYLLVTTLWMQSSDWLQGLYYTVLLPSGVGSMMTGMMMGFMVFHCPHNILWLRIKMVISMLLMLVISLWLRLGIVENNVQQAVYALTTIILLLLLAVMVSYRKPVGKRKSTSMVNKA